MVPRLILVPLFGDDADSLALEAAFALGRGFRAHIDALVLKPDPKDVLPLLGQGLTPPMIDGLVAEATADSARRGEKARAQFEAMRAAAGAAPADRPPGPDRLSAGLRELVGQADLLIGAEARLADLVVTARPDGEDDLSRLLAAEAALLESGRPVLVAPPLAGVGLGRSIAVAWNGRAEAARAVAAALPLLAAAGTVRVLTASAGGIRTEEGGRLVDYLAWHGIAARAEEVVPGDSSVAEALFAAAAAGGADLVVMGGYGHSRLRELVLGGVTHHALTGAALPVLLTH